MQGRRVQPLEAVEFGQSLDPQSILWSSALTVTTQQWDFGALIVCCILGLRIFGFDERLGPRIFGFDERLGSTGAFLQSRDQGLYTINSDASLLGTIRFAVQCR